MFVCGGMGGGVRGVEFCHVKMLADTLSLSQIHITLLYLHNIMQYFMDQEMAFK